MLWKCIREVGIWELYSMYVWKYFHNWFLHVVIPVLEVYSVLIMCCDEDGDNVDDDDDEQEEEEEEEEDEKE